ncbi:MAG TPA: ABC transporter permease [Vicinamibacterales bacterium]|jgi:ABC-2 type transport system permease protein|nr:ABC transporter permease [Vicinamibacterales bacterium]
MGTLLRIGWINLTRDRVTQALVFLLPIVFFSIFASVFGNQRSGTSRISVAVVDEDHSELSARVVDGLEKENGLRVRRTTGERGAGGALDRAAAERLVREGDVPVAVVLPAGFGAGFMERGFGGGGPAIQLLSDVSDQIAPPMVQGLLQKVTMTSAPDLMMQGGLKQFEAHAGQLTPQQRAAVDAWLPRLRNETGGASSGTSVGAPMGVAVDVVDVMRTDDPKGSLISFYAAGIGVMFLLFSAVGGAGGALLEEAESGTLERLLSTNLGMSGLLAGKWVLLAIIGIAQLCVMFLWGNLVFKLPLFSHLPGFFVMTVATAGAAAALGLVLATLARTRAQLSGFSTILILTMSALGGSMFPRFLMSETMQKMGLVTFNAWALDGYLKVFWRNAPVWQLWPQVAVLAGLTIVFLSLARVLARRWEMA